VDTAAKLKDIADRHEAAIIVIAHLRKNQLESGDHLNETLGSVGLVATADCTWTLKRKRGEGTAKFFCSGRNIEDAEFSLHWDRDMASWTITDTGDMQPALPEAQQQILDLLESEARNFTTADISEATGIQKYEVSRQAAALAAKGLIEKPVYGQWKAKNQFASLQYPREAQTCKLPEPPKTAPAAGNSGEPVEEPAIW
jgi:hypothetical protein